MANCFCLREMKPVSKIILPPQLPTDLIGGHFRSFRKDPTGFLTRLSELGDVTSFRMGPQQAFFINDPEYIRDMFVVSADKFVKGRALQRAKALLGEGLLTTEGEVHLRQRRMFANSSYSSEGHIRVSGKDQICCARLSSSEYSRKCIQCCVSRGCRKRTRKVF